MPGTGRHADGKTISLLAAISLGASLLTAAAALPVLGIAGTAARDAARTFNALPVAGLGQLPARSELLDSALAAYLNAAYFENQSYGVEVAAQFYFSTSASNLSLTQAARNEETQ